MDPIDSWLDPAEVRRLAERLIHPSAMIATDAGFDSAFIGYAAHDEEPEQPAALPLVQDSTDEPLHEQMIRFRDWIQQQFSATDIFILDHQGTVIFDTSGHDRLHFLARSVALTAHRLGTSRGNVRVKISAGATLEMIPVKTAKSDWVLGAVVPACLDSASIALIRDTLIQMDRTPVER